LNTRDPGSGVTFITGLIVPRREFFIFTRTMGINRGTEDKTFMYPQGLNLVKPTPFNQIFIFDPGKSF
jgi:hypothetical protein